MPKRKYDFAGWVTKNDIVCADGVTIKHDAFKDNDGQKVPLVWNHDYNSPNNVLGYVELSNESLGVYGYGYFNDTQEAQSAKELVKHGDISSMSIGARKLKRAGNNVIHGLIYEVSLVMAGANPGAMIESTVTHADNGPVDEVGVVYTGTLIHTPEDILNHSDKGGDNLAVENEGKTLEDVIETMNEEQQEAVYAIVGMMQESSDDKGGGEDTTKHSKEEAEKNKKKDEDKEEDEEVKHNVFNQGADTGKEEQVLLHSVNEAIKTAMEGKASSLKEVLESHSKEGEDGLKHGINSIEMLFPEASHTTNGDTPIIYKDPNTSYKRILNAVHKSPFSKVRTLVADLTEEEARAKGYVKGNMKKEEFFSLIKRETTPTTVYKKQKLDRDDIIDITDFNVVSFMNQEMRMMLEEELARAILVGDGRAVDDDDKIDEGRIRPVITDHEFFTIQKQFADANAFVEAVIKAMAEYRGSGMPDMYIDPNLLADVKLIKGTDGRYIFGDIPSTSAIAARLGVDSIVPTSFMVGKGAVIANLKDYNLGAAKGGQITNFDDFDIDFNQYKYLIETRLSGALTMPKSAIHLATSAVTGANDAEGGMTYGVRQSDKTTTTTTTMA